MIAQPRRQLRLPELKRRPVSHLEITALLAASRHGKRDGLRAFRRQIRLAAWEARQR